MAWNATHRVPDGGLPSFVNNQPSTPLDAGLEVEVAERSGDWARVVASNGWECWVAGGTLVPLAAAAAPVAAVAAAGPPSAGPPPTPAAAGTPPPAYVPPAQAAEQDPRRRSGPPWIPILIGVIILLVVGAAGGGYLFLNAQASDVTLEMANAQSSQPFAPSIAPAPASSPSPSAAPAASPQPPPKGPNGVAIYGGSGSNSVCDKQKLIDFLTTHSAEASAWAGVEGISTAQISDFIRPLTPEILSQDVRVTNHGFSNSRATTYQSVFQAGTAVLVNQYGYPVARCLCGNPLTPPVSGKRYHYTGQQWPGFSQTAIVIYVPLPGSMPNGPTTVPAGLADGAYMLAASPDCGDVSVNGASILVRGKTVSITLVPSGEVAHGSVVDQSGSLHMHAANGTALVIDLTGTVRDNGVLTGNGQSGGVHPSGQTGWVCNFAFTASSQTTSTSPPIGAPADLLAVVQLVYPKNFSISGTATCSPGDPALTGCPFSARLHSTLSATIAGFVGHGGAYNVFWGGQNTPGDVLPTYVVTPDPSGGGRVVVDKNGDYDLKVQVTVISQGGRLLIDDIAYCVTAVGDHDVYGQLVTC
jgi:hypothetical protein